jgi:hypothetical protein
MGAENMGCGQASLALSNISAVSPAVSNIEYLSQGLLIVSGYEAATMAGPSISLTKLLRHKGWMQAERTHDDNARRA